MKNCQFVSDFPGAEFYSNEPESRCPDQSFFKDGNFVDGFHLLRLHIHTLDEVLEYLSTSSFSATLSISPSLEIEKLFFD